MSEFSASYHLITSNQQDAADLLKKASLHGYIFPERNGIVTFVIQQDTMDEFKCCEQLLSHNTKPLVFYMNAEDHGWFYQLYDRSECVAGYSSFFNEEELMKGFDYENPELFVPRDDISHYIYSGTFDMEKVSDLFTECVESDKKTAVIQKSKTIVEAQAGMTKELILNLTEEALKAYEFAEEFGIFFYNWISYYYLEMNLKEGHIYDNGNFGKFPVLVV